jgi:RNA polymerase sigma-70 factor, ECF subfamily
MEDMRETIDRSSDGDVVRRVLGGDKDAFEILIERHGGRVFEIVARRVPREDTPEVAQDVFVRAFLSLSGYGGKGEFRAWLAKIAVRACFDYWRERYRRREQPAGALGEDQEEWLDRALSERSGRVHEEETTAAEARDVLAWALGKLSPEDRAVLELVHIEGRSVKEAAALLGWSAVNVKVRAFRSRKKLRAVLDGLVAEREGHHESA